MPDRSRPLAALLLLALGLGALAGEKAWKKPAQDWTREEALAVLTNSPWAKEITLFQLTGRTLGQLSSGEKVVYREAPNLPPRIYSEQPQRLEPETVQAGYAVRWSSARIVQRALARLQELSAIHAQMQAPPPELPEDSYVITVRVTRPPTETIIAALNRPLVEDEEGYIFRDREAKVADLFAELNEETLRQRAELRTSMKLRLKPERVVRHGTGAGEGVSFFFPRMREGEPTLPARTKWAEFTFTGAQGDKLKAKFDLRKMRRDGQPDA